MICLDELYYAITLAFRTMFTWFYLVYPTPADVGTRNKCGVSFYFQIPLNHVDINSFIRSSIIVSFTVSRFHRQSEIKVSFTVRQSVVGQSLNQFNSQPESQRSASHSTKKVSSMVSDTVN